PEHESLGEAEHLLFAAGQRARELVAPLRETGKGVERPLDGGIHCLPVPPDRVAERLEVVSDACAPEDGATSGDLCDAEAKSPLGVEEGDVGAPEANASAPRKADTRDGLQQRGL